LEEFMTEDQIKNTIEATKTAIAGKRGNRTQYHSTLKNDILAAARVMGPSVFAKETGLSSCLISQWKRTARVEKKFRQKEVSGCSVDAGNSEQGRGRSNRSGARELIVSHDPVANERAGFALIRSGNQLEIQVPLELLTPEWVSKVIESLNSRKGGAPCLT
jgi:hypothetical protein